MMKLVLLSAVLCLAFAEVAVFPGAGFPRSAYDLRDLDALLSKEGELCVAHSADGSANLLRSLNTKGSSCDLGAIFFGAAPSHSELSRVPVPVLVVSGLLDGVFPSPMFAAARHISEQTQSKPVRRFVLLPGASHHSIVSSEELTAFILERDMKPEVSPSATIATLVQLVSDFVGASPDSQILRTAELHTAALAKPIVLALQLEGSDQLGSPHCNSDFPTNPTCQYTKWPDHSLPPGPAPAPKPPLPDTCVCGSQWVETRGSELIPDFPDSGRPDAEVQSKDAFHDVSDVHPFHLPHIFTECDTDKTKPCVLNLTTVTMLVRGDGALFPTNSTLSALELRTKLKSRQATWEKAGLGAGSKNLDENATMCQSINQAAYNWALANAEASVLARFQKSGEPYVIMPDQQAPIGITGPTWIKKELEFNRANSTTGQTEIQVQSWSFIVANTNSGNVPWFYPVGMHYCKLLSPARAMEWIYHGGLRRAYQLQ